MARYDQRYRGTDRPPPQRGPRGAGINRGPAPRPGYDRGELGDDYPGFGGYPGGRSEGIHYGERPSHGGAMHGGYAPPPRGRGGYDGRMQGGYAGGPFVPDEAYRRHPEMLRERHREEPWDERSAHAYGQMSPDEAVERAVRERLEDDTWLECDRIDVRVADGVVTLTGAVADFMEARYAWDDAWEAEGVRGVVSHLEVRPHDEAEPHGDPMPQDIHTER